MEGRVFRFLAAFVVLTAAALAPTATHATFTGANGRIVFAARVSGGAHEVMSITHDGTDLVNLSNDPANDRDPAISPDGTKIAFRTDRDGNDEIYLMDADGTNPVRFTNDPGLDIGPTWSPDGTAIMWVRQAAGPPVIHVMNVDGTNDHVVRGIGTFPKFSPDGTKIAFTRRVDPAVPGPVAVFVMNSDGSDLHQVTPTELDGAMAAWAPDGNRLVFSSEFCDPCVESDLYTIKANGKGIRRLTNYVGTGVNAHEPVWSPNGRQILFTHWNDSTFAEADLFVVNTDGTAPVPVASLPGIEREADWEKLSER